MVDVILLEQYLNSIDEALTKLEDAHMAGDINYINRLRVFIFDIQRRIDELINGSNSGGKNV